MNAQSTALCLVLGVWFCSVPFAMGQQSDLYRKEIIGLFTQGKKLVVEKKYDAALIKFKAASALYQQLQKDASGAKREALRRRHANLLYIIGRTHEYNKQWSKAFGFFAKSYGSNPTVGLKKLLVQKILALRPRVEARFELKTKPSGAQLTWTNLLGQTRSGTTPVRWKVLPGLGVIQLKAPQREPLQKKIELEPKGSFVQTLQLHSRPTKLEIITKPAGAIVELRGGKTYRGESPFSAKVPPGEYALSLRLEGHVTRRAKVELRPGKQSFRYSLRPARRSVPPPTPKEPPARGLALGLGFLGVGLALVGGGIGGIFLGLSGESFRQWRAEAANGAQKAKDLGRPLNEAEEAPIRAHFERGETQQIIAIAGFIAGGVGAVLAVVMFAWGGGKAPSPKTSQLPHKPTAILGCFSLP